jgi:hypothetical protein
VTIITRLWAALRRWFTPPELSPRALEMLAALAARGGYVGDHEPFAEEWDRELIEASRHGLVNPGSGLDVGWGLTAKGQARFAVRDEIQD